MPGTVSVFTEGELAYLHDQRRLARVATVGKDGTPHVVPVGWAHNPEHDTIDVTGHQLQDTKKFRDVLGNGRAAIVIDDLASTTPFRPRAIEVRGRGEAITHPEALIRIHPERIVSWGIDPQRNARTVNAPGRYGVGVNVAREGALTWRPLTSADLPLLVEWLAEPRVARWWNHEPTAEAVERDFGASVRGEEPGEDLVVSLDGCPIGLLQRSVIREYPEHLAEFAAIVEVPEGAVELDYLIADPALRGRGLGARMIAAAVQDTWSAHPAAPAVLVAVVAANVASWRALEKAGLRRIAEGAMSPDNPIDDPLHYVYRVDRPDPDDS